MPKNIQTTRYFLPAIIKKLQQRINTLDRQYPRLVKKRSILARNLSEKAFALFNNPKATAADIILAAELMAAIASGYTNKETLQENQFGFAEKLLQIKRQLLILASLVEHKKEKFKEFDKLIEETKAKINNLIKELKK